MAYGKRCETDYATRQVEAMSYAAGVAPVHRRNEMEFFRHMRQDNNQQTSCACSCKKEGMALRREKNIDDPEIGIHTGTNVTKALERVGFIVP